MASRTRFPCRRALLILCSCFLFLIPSVFAACYSDGMGDTTECDVCGYVSWFDCPKAANLRFQFSCEGHNPAYSCPAGYHRQAVKWAGNGWPGCAAAAATIYIHPNLRNWAGQGDHDDFGIACVRNGVTSAANPWVQNHNKCFPSASPSSSVCDGTACGPRGTDYCGRAINCGGCPSGQTCQSGTCVSSCTAESNSAFCERLNKRCGSFFGVDNCGYTRTVDCTAARGPCPSGQSCVGNQCTAPCSPETNAQFCTRNGARCGSYSANDNCGAARTVDCTAALGACPSGQFCVNNQCISSCSPESNAQFCTRLDARCGSMSALDNCDVWRTVDCTAARGPCPSGQSCAGNQCVGSCTPESDSAFCTRLGARCGNKFGTDNCGQGRTANCTAALGNCPSGQSCVSNQCVGSCTPESDSAFCVRLNRRCGSSSGDDNCGASRTVDCTAARGPCPIGETCQGGQCVSGCSVGTRCDGNQLITTVLNSSGCVQTSVACGAGCQGGQCNGCPDAHCDGNTLVTVIPQTCTEQRTACADRCDDSGSSPVCTPCTPGSRCDGSHQNLITTSSNCSTSVQSCPGGCEDLLGNDRCRTCNPITRCEGHFLVSIANDCSRNVTSCQSGCEVASGTPRCRPAGCTPEAYCDGRQLRRVNPDCSIQTLMCPQDCKSGECVDFCDETPRCSGGDSISRRLIDGKCVESRVRCDKGCNRETGTCHGCTSCFDCDEQPGGCTRQTCRGCGACFFTEGRGMFGEGSTCNPCGLVTGCKDYAGDKEACLDDICGLRRCNYCGGKCIDDPDGDCNPEAKPSGECPRDAIGACVPLSFGKDTDGSVFSPLGWNKVASDSYVTLWVNQQPVRIRMVVHTLG